MKTLFEPARINTLTLPNRFVRSATWAGMADEDGNGTPALIDLLAALAQGGVGLIVTGHAYVHLSGKHAPRQLGIDSDSRIDGLRALTRAVHDQGGKIAVQLGYGGAYLSKSRVRQLTAGDMHNLATAFAQAAVRARKSGFDAVQIFAAHGFLLSQLLCPRYNVRADTYGGPLRNRARLLLETADAVRSAVGADYPVLVKLNAHDGIDDGLIVEESVQVGAMLEARGVDAIELSGGLLNNPNLLKGRSHERAYFESEARLYKARIGVPLILVGGIRSLETAGRIVSEGTADMVSLSRPLICEPGLVNRWKGGDAGKAACISCNNCVEQIKAGGGVRCVPLAPGSAPSFFPQTTVSVSASPPHPVGACYVVSFGLLETASGYLPMVKTHLCYPGDETEMCPSFPVGSDDHDRVARAVSALLTRQSS
jgi:2,4-dienoyl-CoA reductase-like NADH-dependent reductase (Old Yellow Enzyme family)